MAKIAELHNLPSWPLISPLSPPNEHVLALAHEIRLHTYTALASIAFSGDNGELQCTFTCHVNSALIETPMNSKAFLIKLRGADAWLCDEFISGGKLDTKLY